MCGQAEAIFGIPAAVFTPLKESLNGWQILPFWMLQPPQSARCYGNCLRFLRLTPHSSCHMQPPAAHVDAVRVCLRVMYMYTSELDINMVCFLATRV